MNSEEYQNILDLLKREVVPAIGCTEPIAVALCAAKARELLGDIPEYLSVELSANVLKNAMGVGIPSTDMVGLPIAIALGTLIGKSDYGLEVLKESNKSSVQAAKQFVDEKRIEISLKESVPDKLYIEVTATKGERSSKAIIAGSHTKFIYLEAPNELLLDEKTHSLRIEEKSEPELNLKKVYDFSISVDLDRIAFILEAARLNKKAAQLAFEGEYGHSLGKMIRAKEEIQSDSFTRALSYTAAACDARMAGAMIPVMSNSGSGNQGISATLPVLIYAEDQGKSREELARALVLSHLTAIYIKQNLGKLSALCGCVVAATGSSCGITWLMGGGYKEISYAVQNVIANITGMICDGAKPSCSLKVSTGVSTAILSALMALEGKCVRSTEGIIDSDVDKTIKNLTKIGATGMNETDKLVLDIMISKC